MSTFDDQFSASATPALVSSFGDTGAVVFALDSGDSTVDAIVGPEAIVSRQTEEGEENVCERSVMIEEADKPATLQIGTSATVDGVAGYSVEKIGSAIGGLVELGLMRFPIKRLGGKSRYAA